MEIKIRKNLVGRVITLNSGMTVKLTKSVYSAAGGSEFYYLLSDITALNGNSHGALELLRRYDYLYAWISQGTSPEDDYITFWDGDSSTAQLWEEIDRKFNNLEENTQEEAAPKPDYFLKNVIGDQIYKGVGSYHSHGWVTNSVTLKGKPFEYYVGVELEVECNNAQCYNFLKEATSNYFYLETDGSLRNKGVEIITVKLDKKTACDPRTWRNLVEKLAELGATSHNNRRCGLHVHISKTALGRTDDEQDETVGKLMHMYHNELGGGGYGTDYITRVMRRGYVGYAQNPVNCIDRSKRNGFNFLQNASLDDLSFNGRKKLFKDLSKAQHERTSAINCRNEKTIEFRQGRGTLKTESIVTTIQFCCELVEFARVASPSKCTRDNFMKRIKQLAVANPLRQKLIVAEDI